MDIKLADLFEHKDMPKIREWIKFACISNKRPELIEKIQVCWNNRYTWKAGVAHFRDGLERSWISLSPKLWEIANNTDPDENRQTIIHEACHIIARTIYGRMIKSHGYEWKHTMMNCNVEPRRCHKIDTSSIVRKNGRQARTEYNCIHCGHTYHLSANIVGRIRNKTRQYICRYCRNPIVFQSISITLEKEENNDNGPNWADEILK